MSINVSVPVVCHNPILMLADLVPGNLYSVVTPALCKGDVVLAVRSDSGSRAAKQIVILDCRQPFKGRAPFLGRSSCNGDRWLFEPAPKGTAVTIKND